MPLSLRHLLASLMLLLLTAPLIAGGGWVKKKGEAYYKLNQAYVNNMGYYGEGGLFLSSLETTLITTSFYSEIGLGEHLSMELFMPFYVRHSVEGSNEMGNSLDDATGGIGDINLGFRANILKRDMIAISATGTLGIPSGDATLGENGNLFTGDDEFNQIIRTDVSVPFGNEKVSGFATVYGGFNNRNDFFTDEWLYGVEAGVSIMKNKLWLITRLNVIEAPNSPELAMATNGFVSSMSFTSYGAELAFYTSPKAGISAGYLGLLDGDILLVEPSYNVGFFWDIR